MSTSPPAPPKEPASVSGQVTIAGKGASGVTVVATAGNSIFDTKTVAKATTDDEGNYKLSGLPPGRLRVFPLVKAFVAKANDDYKGAEESINVGEGEVVTEIDFELVRGGVVTGRITDADGRPIIGERVSVVKEDSTEFVMPMTMFDGGRYQTDDRGVYRIYGLQPGNYKVSVGQAAAEGGVTVMGLGGSQYVKTFYPGVQDKEKATLIEVKEAGEIRNIDITVNKPGSGFSASGRVVDADSGQPVSNVYIAHSSINEKDQDLGGMNFTGVQADANGKFRLEGLRPGHYAVYIFAVKADNSTYSEPAQFEITSGDVTGIEIKIRSGATLSGVAVLDNPDPSSATLLQTVSLIAYSQKKGGGPSYSRSQIAADGSFQFGGLAPGKTNIHVQGFPPPKGLTLERTEVNGVEQTEGIELTAGQKLSGVRLVFVYGTGSVRGEIKIEDDREAGLLEVEIRSAPGDARRFSRTTLVDDRSHFVLENIPPGNYEFVVRIKTYGNEERPGSPELGKQVVTVTNGTEVKLNLTIKLPDEPLEEGDPQ
jgi:protocatechuate 3,4-dioxygenase beta subunit